MTPMLRRAIPRLVFGTLGAHVNPAGLGTDIARARDVAELHQRWIAGTDRLADEAHTAGVPQPSRQLLAKILGEGHTRIDKLNDRFMELALAGRAAATVAGTDRPMQ